MLQPHLVCADCIKNQTDQPFSLWLGLSQKHQQQLLAFTKNDQLITKNTSDDERFASTEKLINWLNGNRLVYALTPQENPTTLAGIFWFSREDLPISTRDQTAKASHWTMGIRIYHDFRGQRLSVPFLTAAFRYFWQNNPTASVWLSTHRTNYIGQKIYEQFGARQIAAKRDKLFYIIEPK